MERAEFLKNQYLMLRDEIKEAKARIFYIAAIGLFVLPGGQYLCEDGRRRNGLEARGGFTAA
jgi:hypothetical protein